MAQESFFVESQDRIADIFGIQDQNVLLVERAFNVVIINRDIEIKITGSTADCRDALKVLKYLIKVSELSGSVSEQNVNYAIGMVREGAGEQLESFDEDIICISSKGRPIKAKTLGQKEYIRAIEQNTITFGLGPAGTGKTFLAVAMATVALRNKQVSKIVITRPAVEAGERLGFLPGDLQSKIDPYLRPLYDALYEMMGYEGFQRQLEKGAIEVAPLAYMRGRTLDDSFIILDEAQNTTPEQMKMFLTRLGFRSKAVVNGDLSQIDLPSGQFCGLKQAIGVVKDIEGIAVYRLGSKDVVRNGIVAKIVEAYDRKKGDLC
ncbi:MAG: PhoH family protein [Ruminococcaceae bacterium]|nr:PhoH family protein [Oscillospiraceae bacterium]